MKKNLNKILVLLIIVAAFFVTGCTKDPAAGFKNPKTIEYTADKGTIKLTYDDDGTYEEVNNDPYITLKNKDANFRVDIDFSNSNVKEQQTSKENFKKDKNYIIVDNLDFNGYKGYAMIQKEYTTANVYLVLDEANDIVSNIKVSPVMTSLATDELDKGTKPEDVIFNQEKVQQILKTVTYEKK